MEQLSSQEVVRKKFCCAQVWTPLTKGRNIEIHADSSKWPLPHLLGSGSTEQEAWDNAAYNVRNPWNLQEQFDLFIKKLCG